MPHPDFNMEPELTVQYDVLWSIDYLCSTHFTYQLLPAGSAEWWYALRLVSRRKTQSTGCGWIHEQLDNCIWSRSPGSVDERFPGAFGAVRGLINVHLGDNSPKTHMVRAFSFEHQKTCHCRQTGTCCSPTILSLSRLWHALLRKHGCMKRLKRAKTIRANAHACLITRVSFLYI
jgi:hypothetical protein